MPDASCVDRDPGDQYFDIAAFDRAPQLNMITTSTRECPACHATIPIDPGYPNWCGECAWGLDIPERLRALGRHPKWYLDISAAESERLFASIVATGPSAARLTLSRGAAIIIADLIHLSVLAILVAGVALLITHPNSFLTLLGGALFVVALVVRPRIAGVPRHNILSRDQFPKLYELTERIAAHLGTKPLAAILVTEELNVFFFRAGWTRQNFLCLGIPFLEILTPQERVALIGHELAHSANGDATRGFFVGSAIRSLNAWRSRVSYEDDEIDAMRLGMSILMLGTPWLAGRLLELLSSALTMLLANDSQRGEYLADSMGARVGGSEAMVNVLHKTYMTDALGLAMSRYFETGARSGVVDVLRSRVERVPPREIERVRRIEELVDSRLDASHPPTRFRVKMIEAWPVTVPAVVLSPDDIDAIEYELSRIRPELEDLMLQAYRDQINY